MHVNCRFCDAKYTVSEDLVRGRVARFRCRRCGGTIPVNGTVLAPSGGAQPNSVPPLVITTGVPSSSPPGLSGARRTPSVVPPERASKKSIDAVRWVGVAASFGLAIVAWKVLSPTATARQPVGDAVPVLATGGVDREPGQIPPPSGEPASGSDPAVAPVRSKPERAVDVVAPAARRSAARPSGVAEEPAAQTVESVPSGMPSSGYLPDPVPTTIAAFDRVAAIAALDAAAQRAQACKPPDTLGATRVAVTFAPTGKVTTAVVQGPPFAGTRVGGCIAEMLRDAAIPPFSGYMVTVHRSL
jgi:hypothetical protein